MASGVRLVNCFESLMGLAGQADESHFQSAYIVKLKTGAQEVQLATVAQCPGIG
jgi:hypothetical protein